MKNAINIAIIGCGMRARSVISTFYAQLGDKLKIRALYDPDPESVRRLSERLNITLPETSPSMEAAVNHPEVDRVMIFTPNALHCEANISIRVRESTAMAMTVMKVRFNV